MPESRLQRTREAYQDMPHEAICFCSRCAAARQRLLNQLEAARMDCLIEPFTETPWAV